MTNTQKTKATQHTLSNDCQLGHAQRLLYLLMLDRAVDGVFHGTLLDVINSMHCSAPSAKVWVLDLAANGYLEPQPLTQSTITAVLTLPKGVK